MSINLEINDNIINSVLFNNNNSIDKKVSSKNSPILNQTKIINNNVSQSDEDSVCEDIDRWASSSIDDSSSQINCDPAKIWELEEEHERLNEAVLSLSTHFAHIQFRIQQITAAPTEQRDEMLKKLQEFSSKGCIDLNKIRIDTKQLKNNSNNVNEKNERVNFLIKQLRSHLEDLERFAYDNGYGDLPLSELKQRQKLVFDKLQKKIRLKIELEKFSKQELDKSVDEGIERILNPLREKNQLVDQLQTQIVDLERFVLYLQQECAAFLPDNYSFNSLLNDNQKFETKNSQNITKNKVNHSPTANSPLHKNTIETNKTFFVENANEIRSFQSIYRNNYNRQNNSFDSSSFLLKWFGCKSQKFEKNELKKTSFCNYYGDQRARLELAVDQVIQILQKYQILNVDRSEREMLPVEQLNETIFECSEEAIVLVVRKNLCPALKDLLEHGLKEIVTNNCEPLITSWISHASKRQSTNAENMNRALRKYEGKKLEHIWDVIQLFYYCSRVLEMKNEAVGRLSDAYKIDLVDGKMATSKQILLTTIENVRNTHLRLHRSSDTMWKAFVSAALNHNRLPGWIRIIFRSNIVLTKCYHSWSFVARTGCEDLRPLLERLHQFNFDLPVDLAVRPFEFMKEAF